MSRVLLVEDEPRILATLVITVRASGYEVTSAATAADALSSARRLPPDIVVLDLGLPDADGLQVITELRTWTDVPIIVLSGRTGSRDKVTALDAGADDYVTKPFGTEELLARLRAARRRAAGPERVTRVTMGDLVIDLPTRTVIDSSTRVVDAPAPSVGPGRGDRQLTPTEWDLLEILVRNPGRLISQTELALHVWGKEHGEARASLRVYLARLRRKLEPDPSRPRYLVTEPGLGYRFRP